MFLADPPSSARAQAGRAPSPSMAGRSTVYAPHGAIATSQPLATAAGLEGLQHGGNAIDAAVTAAAVLNVVEPMMTGIGGDRFALAHSSRSTRCSPEGTAQCPKRLSRMSPFRGACWAGTSS